MTNAEINNAIAELYRTANALEELYTENGGEVTDETAEKEDQLEALRALLNTEGVDSLGRWLAGKEQEKALLQAEKAAIDTRIKAVNNTISYIKSQVAYLLQATGAEACKGLLYGFKAATSTRNAVNQDALEEKYLERAKEAARRALIPEYVHIVLKATASELSEAGAVEFIDTTTEDTVRFTKPRKAKEKEDE